MTQLLRNYLLFFFILILINNCSDDKNPVINEKLPDLFVVDSFNTSITIKNNTDYDSLWAFFSYSFQYHFENRPGVITKFYIRIEEEYGQGMNINPVVPPFPIDKKMEISFDFWERYDFLGLDSVKIECEVSGSFLTYDENNVNLHINDPFTWSNIKRIPVIRE